MSDEFANEHLHDGDVGPGFMETPEPDFIRQGIRVYLLGLALAAVLTVASFYIEGTHLIWGPGVPVMLIVLAVAQIGVHLVFFLHITTAPDNTNNILALAFGVLIVALIFGGSVWIMAHMTQNMMAMPIMPGRS